MNTVLTTSDGIGSVKFKERVRRSGPHLTDRAEFRYAYNTAAYFNPYKTKNISARSTEVSVVLRLRHGQCRFIAT